MMTGNAVPSHPNPNPATEDNYAPYIARAKATEGGHLMIGAYGFTLWFGAGCRLSGGDLDAVRAVSLAAGLPVIDTRGLASAVLTPLVLRMPLVAVGEPADPPPWPGLARAPLAYVAALYRGAGAVVQNLPPWHATPAEEGEGR